MPTSVSLNPAVLLPISRLDSTSKAGQALSAADEKTHCLVILQKLLEGIAILLTGASLVFCFVYTPAALIGLVPAVAFAALAHWVGTFRGKPLDLDETPIVSRSPKAILESRKVKAGAPSLVPIGLDNAACNCWANAMLQMIMHVESLKTAALLLPPNRFRTMHAFIEAFENAQRNHLGSAPGADSQKIRLMINDLNERISVDAGHQEDAVEGIDALFGGEMQDNILNKLQANGMPPAPYFGMVEENSSALYYYSHILRARPIQGDHRSLKELLIASYLGRPRQMIFRAPSEFLLQVARFTPEGLKVISRVNMSPNGFEFPEELLKNKEKAKYSCDAFIQHIHFDDAYPTISSGHYVAWIKVGRQWYCCNDRNVTAQSDVAAHAAMNVGDLFHFKKTT